jgi:hypothetical protein
VLPPGEPRSWSINVIRGDEGGRLAVEVAMWTREEGRSDLTLELELWRESNGSVGAEFHNLHVMWQRGMFRRRRAAVAGGAGAGGAERTR